jgi:hypothetical protein
MKKKHAHCASHVRLSDEVERGYKSIGIAYLRIFRRGSQLRRKFGDHHSSHIRLKFGSA